MLTTGTFSGRRAGGWNEPRGSRCWRRLCSLQAVDENWWAHEIQLYGLQRRWLRLRNRATARSW